MDTNHNQQYRHSLTQLLETLAQNETLTHQQCRNLAKLCLYIVQQLNPEIKLINCYVEFLASPNRMYHSQRCFYAQQTLNLLEIEPVKVETEAVKVEPKRLEIRCLKANNSLEVV